MTNQRLKTRIAEYLKVSLSKILKIETWANCLFVVVKGIGARFVSKKIAPAMLDFDIPGLKGTPKQIAWAENIRSKRLKEAKKVFHKLLNVDRDEDQAENMFCFTHFGDFGSSKDIFSLKADSYTIEKCFKRVKISKTYKDLSPNKILKFWENFLIYLAKINNSVFWIEKGNYDLAYLFQHFATKYLKEA